MVQTTADEEFVAFQRELAGEYSLERELGRGGMGIVYLARDVQLDRKVAIKVLPASLASRAELRERFQREARTAAGLSHPNIVPIHRVGEAGEFVFFVMAYIEGESLGQRLREHGPLTPAAAAKILREVAWALAYAHGRGVVHRDIKPDNILLERETGRALVSDFGIAQVAAVATLTDGAVTEPGQVMGTAHFMSPEQAANDPLDGRSDLYSLGVVGFLALAGRLPFQASSIHALLAKQLTELPPPLVEASPAVPERLARAIDRCLRKDRDERFASGEALAEALEPATAAHQRQLPTPLRVWVQQQNPLRGAYVAWSGLTGLAAAGQFIEILTASQRAGHRGSPLVPLGLALLPIIPSAIFHLRQTYRVLRAGYSLADLRFALTRWRTERREELAFELDEELTLPLRVLRIATYASVPAFAAWIVGAIRLGVLNDSSSHSLLVGRVAGALFFAIPATIVASSALGVPLLPRRISRAISLGEIRTRFWNSRVGAWTAKVLGGNRRGTPDQLVDRPTEMVLGLAASELFAALPEAYRDQLHELPAVVQQLEARATTLRRRIEETATIVAQARGERPASALLASADATALITDRATHDAALERLVANHDQLRRDLGRTVATLESIRLDLLRVHGGANDLESLTTLLDAAGEVERELGFLIDAQEEVRSADVPRLDLDEGVIATPI